MVDTAERWVHINRMLNRTSPLAPSHFAPDTPQNPKVKEYLQNAKILVIGAGGLGCELLKDLTLSGFRHIHVIDMDTIDLSNLNRQFLFRIADIGSSKANVAANFVNQRVAGANVVPHFGRIQDKEDSFYRQFKLIVCGLDSVEARRWINSTLVKLLQYDSDGNIDPDSVIPLIDGGTEGFKGHCRVVVPGITACLECSIEMYPPQLNFPVCTIANTPRIPEHCIEWASLISWEKEKPFLSQTGEALKIDTDNQFHIRWLYERAKGRAEEFNITGVTYRLTLGVIKNIIPAVASTNAIISAACANEAFKIITESSQSLNNWMAYNGVTGVYTHSFEYERNPDCVVCSQVPRTLTVSPQSTLENLVEMLLADSQFQLKRPSISSGGKNLFVSHPEQLREMTKGNLEKTISSLINENDEVYITDPAIRQTAVVFLKWSEC